MKKRTVSVRLGLLWLTMGALFSIGLTSCADSNQAMTQEAVSMPRGQSGSFLVDGDYSEGTFFGTDLSPIELPEIEPISLHHDDSEFIAFMEDIASILAAGPVDFCRIHHTVTVWIQAPVHNVFPDSSEKALAYVNSLIAVNANLSEVAGSSEQRDELKRFADHMLELRDVKVLRVLFGIEETEGSNNSASTADDDSSPDAVDGPLTDEQRAQQLAEVTRAEDLLDDVDDNIALIQQVVSAADYRAHRECQ